MRLNISKVWKLTAINCVIVIISIVLMFQNMIYHLILGDPLLLIVFISLLSVLLFNIILIIFVIKTENLIFEQVNSRESNKSLIKDEFKIQKLKEISTDNEKKYMTKEDLELEIPIIPEAPKKKEKITKDTQGLSMNIINEIKKMESDQVQVVLVNCDRCKGVIPVPIPKKAVLESDLPVVPISYVHSMGNDKHCITLHLDHDFDIRRQRISEVVLS